MLTIAAIDGGGIGETFLKMPVNLCQTTSKNAYTLTALTSAEDAKRRLPIVGDIFTLAVRLSCLLISPYDGQKTGGVFAV